MSAVAMAACVDCERDFVMGDLATVDGNLVREPCVEYRGTAECADCRKTVDKDDLADVSGDLLCAACVEAREDDDGDQCGTCAGTGIGQHGDPDTSSCHDCSSSVRRPGSDPDEAYDRYRDRDF